MSDIVEPNAEFLVRAVRDGRDIGGRRLTLKDWDRLIALANRGVEAAAEIERLREALEICGSWLERWAKHVGDCRGGPHCTCGLTAVQYDCLEALTPPQQEDA